MAHLKEFSRASAPLTGDDDDDVDIPDPILWDLAGGNVSEAKGDDDDDLPDIIIWDIDGGNVTPEPEGGLPGIVVHDDDDESSGTDHDQWISIATMDHSSADTFEFAADAGHEEAAMLEVAEVAAFLDAPLHARETRAPEFEREEDEPWGPGNNDILIWNNGDGSDYGV